MSKSSTKASVRLSIFLAAVFLLAVAVCAVTLPQIVELLIEIPDTIGNRDSITLSGKAFVLTVSYLILALCAFAGITLLALLTRVRRGLVFTRESVTCIGIIFWCCIALALLFGLLVIFFQLAAVVSFVAVFGGLCLRVVRNVIEEAAEIKSENDLTI